MNQPPGKYDFSKITEALKVYGFEDKDLLTEGQLRTALRELEERGREMIHHSNQMAIELRLIEKRADSATPKPKTQSQCIAPNSASSVMPGRKQRDDNAEIRAGLVTQGTATLKYHALRSDETAACSSYLPVQPMGLAHEIDNDIRCKSKSCMKLFKEADLKAANANKK